MIERRQPFRVASAGAALCASLLTVSQAKSAFQDQSAGCDLSGTYKLVADQREVVDTGEVVRVAKPQGYISYGAGKRMLVVIVREPRPMPVSVEAITERDRVALFDTVTAYSGTFDCDASSVTHHIDLSWNSAWTGTTQVRSIKRDGNRLTYMTPPFRFFSDGRMSVGTLVWEKLP